MFNFPADVYLLSFSSEANCKDSLCISIINLISAVRGCVTQWWLARIKESKNVTSALFNKSLAFRENMRVRQSARIKSW